MGPARGDGEEGRPVLKTRVAREGWDYGTSEYISLDAKSQNDPKNRTYRELLKGAKVQIAIAKSPSGEIVEAVKREDAAAFMSTKFNFAKKREAARTGEGDREHEAVLALSRKTRELAIAEAVKVVERRQPKAGFLRAVIHALEWSNPDLLGEALTRRGLGEDVHEALESVKDEAMLRGIIAELVCGEPSHVEENGRTELFAAYGIEEKSFAKAAKAELAKEAAAAKEKKK